MALSAAQDRDPNSIQQIVLRQCVPDIPQQASHMQQALTGATCAHQVQHETTHMQQISILPKLSN
jgi:hypothetical protein